MSRDVARHPRFSGMTIGALVLGSDVPSVATAFPSMMLAERIASRVQ